MKTINRAIKEAKMSGVKKAVIFIYKSNYDNQPRFGWCTTSSPLYNWVSRGADTAENCFSSSYPQPEIVKFKEF